MVLGEDDTIILKKLEVPSFKGFDKLLKKTREFVQKKGLKSQDVEDAVLKTRTK